MKQLKSWMLAAAIVCGAVAFMTGCKEAKANETNDEEAVKTVVIIRYFGAPSPVTLDLRSS